MKAAADASQDVGGLNHTLLPSTGPTGKCFFTGEKWVEGVVASNEWQYGDQECLRNIAAHANRIKHVLASVPERLCGELSWLSSCFVLVSADLHLAQVDFSHTLP